MTRKTTRARFNLQVFFAYAQRVNNPDSFILRFFHQNQNRDFKIQRRDVNENVA